MPFAHNNQSMVLPGVKVACCGFPLKTPTKSCLYSGDLQLSRNGCTHVKVWWVHYVLFCAAPFKSTFTWTPYIYIHTYVRTYINTSAQMSHYVVLPSIPTHKKEETAFPSLLSLSRQNTPQGRPIRVHVLYQKEKRKGKRKRKEDKKNPRNKVSTNRTKKKKIPTAVGSNKTFRKSLKNLFLLSPLESKKKKIPRVEYLAQRSTAWGWGSRMHVWMCIFSKPRSLRNDMLYLSAFFYFFASQCAACLGPEK